MSGGQLNLAWKSPGPVSSAFMASTAMQQILNGPVGSGKTTTVIIKALAVIATQQAISPRRRITVGGVQRPVRMVKMAAIRETYRQLHRATLPTWFERVPREIGDFSGADNGPCVHTINFVLDDGSVVEFIAEFGAIADTGIEDFARGYNVTFCWLNEIDLLRKEVNAHMLTRTGRYPEKADGGATWRGILGDCNAPDFDNWLYRDTEKDETGKNKPGIFTMTPEQRKALDVDLFIQPGGRDPGAENRENLPADYYEPKAGQSAYHIARMIDNKSGWSQAGMPVHPEFKPALHVASTSLRYVPGIRLVVGLDPRTYPSAVFLQHHVSGQRRILRELQGEINMGARRFGKLLADDLHQHFPGVKPEAVYGVIDPTAFTGADKEAGELYWAETLSAVSGIRIVGAASNNLTMRREALKKPLSELIDGEPAILIDPGCTNLITGLSSGFRFRKLQKPGADEYSAEVEKNYYADVCEAAEYACLEDGADLEILERKNWQQQATRVRQAQSDYDPFGGGE